MHPYNPRHRAIPLNTHYTNTDTDQWGDEPDTTALPKRVPGSPQLRLHYDHSYQGWPVSQQIHYNGLVENYLENAWKVIGVALADYPRLYAVRVDLRYPQTYPAALGRDNGCMKRFFDYLQRELDRAGLKYPTRIHYIWAREQDSSPNPHYHLLLMLNRDAINHIGTFAPCSDGGYHRQNLFHRIVRAWCYALRLENDWQAEGLVHYAESRAHDTGLVYDCDIPGSGRVTDHDSGQYQITRGVNDLALAQLHYRASYLCKAYSKPFHQGVRCFVTSQRRVG